MFNLFKVSRFFLIAAVFCVVIVTASTLFPFIVGKYVWFRTSIDLALIFFLLGLLFAPDASLYLSRLKKAFRSPLVIAVTVFAAVFLLACFFGVNPANSFWSNFERGEGGFQMLHLYLFFLLLVLLFREEKNWQKIFSWSLVAAVLLSLYGFVSASGIQGFIGPKFSDPGFRFQGSLGNPAYVATYMLFIMAYVLYLFASIYQRKLKKIGSWVLLLMFIFSFAVFIMAATRGAFIGFVAGLICFVGFLTFAHRSRWRKPLLSITGLLVLIILILIVFQQSSFVQKIPYSRIFDISVTTQTFHDRTVIWKMAWDGFLARPILGWGPENFLSVFDQHFNIAYFNPAQSFGAWFDRAHSLIFDYLVETGILGFLSFVSIFIALYWLLFKAQFKKVVGDERGQKKPEAGDNGTKAFINAIVFALPIAYVVQGLVLFDILPTYLNVFLFLAFAAYKFFPLNEK